MESAFASALLDTTLDARFCSSCGVTRDQWTDPVCFVWLSLLISTRVLWLNLDAAGEERKGKENSVNYSRCEGGWPLSSRSLPHVNPPDSGDWTRLAGLGSKVVPPTLPRALEILCLALNLCLKSPRLGGDQRERPLWPIDSLARDPSPSLHHCDHQTLQRASRLIPRFSLKYFWVNLVESLWCRQVEFPCRLTAHLI